MTVANSLAYTPVPVRWYRRSNMLNNLYTRSRRCNTGVTYRGKMSKNSSGAEHVGGGGGKQSSDSAIALTESDDGDLEIPSLRSALTSFMFVFGVRSDADAVCEK